MGDALRALAQAGRQSAALAEAIREMAGDDDLAFVDTLDGETDAVSIARAAVRMVVGSEAQAEAAKGLSDLYAGRRRAFEDRAGRARDALAHFMAEIGQKTLPLPEGTISLAAGGVQLAGDPDLASLSEDLVQVTRTPNRTAITAALGAGREVPGCSLTNGRPRLQIRVR